MIYYSTAIKLYETEIDPRRNLYIEEIEQYLDECKSTQFIDFKRFTPSQSITVKLDYSDQSLALSNYLHTSFMFNYARVTYASDAGVGYFWYYFVSSIELIADATISVTLSLDSINSFRNWTGALTARTYVNRQLTHRWNDDGTPVNIFRPEDVSGSIIKDSERYVTTDPRYLIFDGINGSPSLEMTNDDGLITKDRIYIDRNYLKGKFVDESKFCICLGFGTKLITYEYMLPSTNKTVTMKISTVKTCYVGFIKLSDGMTYKFIIDSDGTVLGSAKNSWNTIVRIEAIGSFTASLCTVNGTTTDDISFEEPYTTRTRAFNSIDRSLSSICKIVEIPFAPDNESSGCFKFIGSYDETSTAYSYSIRYILDSLETQPIHSIDLSLANIVIKRPSTLTKSEALLKDPKIYSGAFSYYKVVYDSYSSVINLENINTKATDFRLKWYGSSAISSSSIVMLEQLYYTSTGNEVIVEPVNVEEDYPILLTSDRNNELPLYSSEWLNYLRNGYNYDKKANSLGIVSSLASTLGALISGAATIASGGSSAAATIPTMVAMTTSAVHGWTNTASTINSQLAKETQLKNQSASVSTINDISLFKIYGKGTIKVEWWTPRTDYKLRLGKLFFYRGYAVNSYLNPDLHCRTSFDYIECIPSWSGDFIKRTPPQFISLLNDRLQEGVTIIHYYENTWDIAQEKGNLEV